MAWFVFGRRHSVKATPNGAQIRARCPECAREATFSACEATTSYTAFFVVPLWTRAVPCFRCSQCGAEVELAEDPSPTESGAGVAADPMRAVVEARVDARRKARQRAARERASTGAGEDPPASHRVANPAGARRPAATGADASKAAQIEAELEALKRKLGRSPR